MMIKEDPKMGSIALPVTGEGSGNFFSLAGSDGFVELNKDTEVFKKGEIFPFYPWNRS